MEDQKSPRERYLFRKPLGCGGGLAFFLALLALTDLLGWLGFFVASGSLLLINALLLRMGIMKPGSILGGDTPLGASLIGLGAIGFGLLFIPSEYQLSAPVSIVVAASGLLFSAGVIVEWKAPKERKSKAKPRD